ncbi:ionic transporter y4hA [Luteococcus sp. H138]
MTLPAPIRPLLDWHNSAPLLALTLMLATWGSKPGLALDALLVVALVGAILAAVHHAELIAEKIGEPFGSLLLAVAVTVIEVGLIVMLMAGGGAPTLARDTVFAAVMITCNLIVGLAIMGGVDANRKRTGKAGSAWFNPEGAGGALATVLTVTVLCLVLPSVTTSEPGPVFTEPQLAFAGFFSLIAYGLFVVTQTVKHRDFFLPVDRNGDNIPDEEHHTPPSSRAALASLGLLLAALVSVVGLAKLISPALEKGVASVGLPHAFVGVVICLVVLAPETLAAVRNARSGRLQISLNLAYGSAMASVGLTIPVLAVLSVFGGLELTLGLSSLHMVLLALTAVVSILTVMRGRVVRLHGGLHLVIAAAFIFLSAMP